MKFSRVAKVISILFIGAIIGFGIAVGISAKNSAEVLARWEQPATIKYGSFDPYTVFVAEGPWDWSQVLFGQPRLYELRIVRGGPKQEVHYSYGYGKVYDFPVMKTRLVEYLKDMKVEWGLNGITVTEPNGVATHFPKQVFIGGR